MSKLTILVGRQKDGYVFRLKPSSKKDIENERDMSDTVSSVFISYDTKHDFEEIHGAVWDQVLRLLTGMSVDEVNRRGGFSVLDPGINRTMYDSVEQHV